MTKFFPNLKTVLFFISLLTFFLLNTQQTLASCSYDNTQEKFFTNNEIPTEITPIYRLYNKRTGVNIYTRGYKDTAKILAKWSDFEFSDGTPAFCANLTQKDGLTPIYRLYNRRTGVHLYTRGDEDKNKVLAKWHDFEFTDGAPAFWASLTEKPGLTPIYRLYNRRTGAHLYTIGDADKDKILNKWHDFEFSDGAPAFWADLALNSGKEIITQPLGSIISIGLHEYSEDDLNENAFLLSANATFNVLDKDRNVITSIDADQNVSVRYNYDKKFEIELSNDNKIEIDKEIVFEAKNIEDKKTIVFDTNRPNSNFNSFRHGIRLRFTDATETIWLINDIPLEQYVWGMGEITGTGDIEHNKVMTTAFRTYGKWKIIYSTKYAYAGFKVNATPGNQLYYGYDWEKTHPNIKKAAEKTNGIIIYDENNTVAIIPYSSWTDGRTRSWKERWGDPNNIFPHCQSVPDPYGKHPTKSTKQLENEGNHMVGLSAHGSLKLANEYHKNWEEILNYYFTNITLKKEY